MTCPCCDDLGYFWTTCAECSGNGCQECNSLGEIQVVCPDCDESEES